jgi:hypothetical protein
VQSVKRELHQQQKELLLKGKFIVVIVNNKMEKETILEKYANQMAQTHARVIDEHFWLVVKKKPKWMPSFLYRAVIKELIEFQQHNYPPTQL